MEDISLYRYSLQNPEKRRPEFFSPRYLGRDNIIEFRSHGCNSSCQIATRSRECYLLYDAQFPYLCYMNIQISGVRVHYAKCGWYTYLFDICTSTVAHDKTDAASVRPMNIYYMFMLVHQTSSNIQYVLVRHGDAVTVSAVP